MGILNEIIDFIKEGKEALNGSNAKLLQTRDRGPRSITREAEEGVLQFPMVASKSIPINILQDIQSASENKYANLIRIVYSLNSTVNMSDNKGLKDYIGKFHQNTKSDLAHIITLTEAMSMFESFEKETIGNAVLESVIYEKASGRVVRENRKQLRNVFEGLNENTLNEMYQPVSESRRTRRRIYASNLSIGEKKDRIDNDFSEERAHLSNMTYALTKKKIDSEINNSEIKNKLDQDKYNNTVVNDELHNSRTKQQMEFDEEKREYAKNKEQRDKEYHDLSQKRTEQQIQSDKERRIYSKNKEGRDSEAHKSRMRGDSILQAKNTRELNSIKLPANTLLDSESKKGNELAPTMLQLVVNIQDDNGTIVGSQEFIIGIKVVIHPISTEEMVANLSTLSKGVLFEFVRWTTGEISFFKDFVFQIDSIKTDVANKSKYASGWIPTLKRRAALNKIKNKFMFGRRLMPNSTLVVSIEEAEYIKANSGIDIMDNRYVDRLFQDYFLLGYVVVDATNEVAHLRYDNTYDFETVSFRGLKKQNNSADFGEMLKMINKF